MTPFESISGFFNLVQREVFSPLEKSIMNAKIVSHRHVGLQQTGDEYRLFAMVTIRTKFGDVPVEAFTRLGEYPREKSKVWEDMLEDVTGKVVHYAIPRAYNPKNGEPELIAIVFFRDVQGPITIRLAHREDPFRLSAPLIGENLADILRTEYGSICR